MEKTQLNKFNCQRCCGSGTLIIYNFLKNLKTITQYLCQCCGHDNTEYVLDDNVVNNMWNHPKRWC